MKRFRLPVVVCLWLVAVLAPAQSNPNLRLGNPSDATTNTEKKDNYLLVKEQYVLSYNSSRGAPNWVSWTLRASDIGTVKRQDNFHIEKSLPNGFQKVKPTDYSGSGFDRGRTCNSKDRTKTIENNKATFSMANMQPQTPDLNRHLWESLEEDSRKLVAKGNTLYIIAGCYGNIGHFGNDNTVTVPKSCWKLAVVDGPNPSVIVVDMPNKAGISKDHWQKYATTLDDIEQKTGFHLTAFPKNP